MSRRLERLGHLIRRIVAHEIQFRLNDPRIARLTSVTRVDVSADLAVARVYVSVMGTEAEGLASLGALRRATGRIQSAVAHEIHARQCPRLRFALDDSLKRAFRTVQIIDREMARLERGPASDVAAPAPADAPAPDASEPSREPGASPIRSPLEDR